VARAKDVVGATSTLVESICLEAAAATGLDDFGDNWFLGPLSAWAEDLQRPNLSEFGRTFFRTLAVRDLARRLRVLATLREHPEIAHVAIPPIVYVTGLERSGTTLLHNLLALHPDARALRRWELMAPVPPPTTETYATDPRIAKVQASVDRLRGSLLERMHWVNAEEPDECAWGFIDSVSMLGQAACLCMPSWRRYLIEEEQTRAFENYRRLVQLLLWKHPVGPEGFLVLKAPQICRRIDEFAATFPEAWFVITDRDPFRCITSIAVLGETVVAPFCVDNPMTGDGRRHRVLQSMAAGKLNAIASFATASPDRLTHVAYPELVNDPVGTVRSLLETGPSSVVDLEGAVSAFLEAQRSGARATPPAELDPMGYDHAELWADPAIGAYCERFNVAPERTRLTGSPA
jgi:hypothetical protein